LVASGCVNKAVINVHHGSDLSNIKSIHVAKFPPDNRGIDKIIANKLVEMGYHASTEEAPLADVDAVITYEDKWMWDITLYMIQLKVTVRDKDGGFPVATSNSMHGSLTRKSPEEMVDEVLKTLFNKNTP
jgi:hypothetical protein